MASRRKYAGDDGPIALTIPVSPPAPRAGGEDTAPIDTLSEEGHSTLPAREAGEGRGFSLSKTPMHSVLVSSHGNWRHQHWQAIVSAYRSSPYFEYYADDLSAVFHQPLVDADGQPLRLVDYNAALRDFVLDALELQPVITVNRSRYLPPAGEGDFRETIRPKIPYTFDPTFRPAPYWQVFASRHGFLPNMSIIDLLFNMGPESRLVLRDSIV